MKDDSEIPDLLPRSRAQPEARPTAALGGPAGQVGRRAPVSTPVQSGRAPELELEAPADVDDLEFDLTRERGSDLPWDSPLREPAVLESGHDDVPAVSLPEGVHHEVPALSVSSTAAVSSAKAVAQPASVAHPASLAHPASVARPASVAHPASIARPAPVARSASLAPPGSVIDLGFESSAWDLDDDLGDPRAAQLNVAVPLPTKDDGPWPLGRTPLAENLSVSAADIERTLALAPPGGFLSSPRYFWSARSALRRLATEVAQASEQLASAERERDALLADLGRELRPHLASLDRFRAACDRVDQHERVVREARAALGMADDQGETGLSQVDAELESAKATVTLRERDAEARREAAAGGERDVARLRAAHQRQVIERRNIVARAQETAGPGANMPPELAGRFLAAEEQIKRSEAELQGALEAQRQLESQLRTAEEEQRRALAHVRRVEGKREGLVLTQQGTLGDLSETLQRAERGHEEVLAELGLAVLELRGEVPVDPEVRGRLLDLDRTVTARALALERVRRAQASVDLVAYGQGRLVLGLTALVVLGLLAWLLARPA